MTDLGRLQAQKACPRLEKMGFQFVTSSDLKRARETAAIIAGELGLELAPPVLELKERHYGEICGLPSPEIDIRFPVSWTNGDPDRSLTYLVGRRGPFFLKELSKGFAAYPQGLAPF